MSTKTTSPNPITIPLAPSSRPRGCSLAEKPETHNHSSPSAGTHLTPMTNDLLTHALHYAASGFSVIPIKRGAKSPAVPWTRWQTECPDPEQLTRWFNNGHHEALGLVTGAVSNGLTILDFDGDGWQQAFEQFLTEFPDLRDTRWIKSGSGKRHLWIAAADLTNGDGQPITRLQFARPDLGEKTAIEVRANTVQTLAPPSRHPSGGRYEFLNEAPILRLDDLHLIITWLAQWAQPPLTTDERYRVSWTADDLLSATLPAPRYIVPDILPEGLNILAARPKIGKSWLALQTCGAVGTGGKVLGYDVARGRALYLALEDGPRRLQDRMKTQRWPVNADVEFELAWPPFINGDGLEKLEQRIANGNYDLLSIDTISRLTRGSRREQERIPEVVDALHRIALDHALCLLLVEHHRKPTATEHDVIDDVLGDTFKTGTPDAILGIYRKRGEPEAHLRTTGRDIEERDLLIEFDKVTGSWQFTGNAATRVLDLDQHILQTIIERGPLGTGEIAACLDETNVKISRRLGELARRGFIIQTVNPADRRHKPWQTTEKARLVLE